MRKMSPKHEFTFHRRNTDCKQLYGKKVDSIGNEENIKRGPDDFPILQLLCTEGNAGCSKLLLGMCPGTAILENNFVSSFKFQHLYFQ